MDAKSTRLAPHHGGKAKKSNKALMSRSPPAGHKINVGSSKSGKGRRMFKTADPITDEYLAKGYDASGSAKKAI